MLLRAQEPQWKVTFQFLGGGGRVGAFGSVGAGLGLDEMLGAVYSGGGGGGKFVNTQHELCATISGFQCILKNRHNRTL